MLTIVMPFYKKNIEFDFVFKNYNLPIFNKINGLQVLIVLDDPEGYADLVDTVSSLVESGFIHFSIKIILNEHSHDWRPPCKAINVGIRLAKYSRILVVSPETLFTPNALECLWHSVSDESYGIGLVKFVNLVSQHYQPVNEMLQRNRSSVFMPYGSILFTQKQADKIGGYDEHFSCWGGDDDDFRSRLKSAGFIQKVTLAKFLHINLKRNHINGCAYRADELDEKKCLDKMKKINERGSYVVNNGVYGYDFSKCIYDYNA